MKIIKVNDYGISPESENNTEKITLILNQIRADASSEKCKIIFPSGVFHFDFNASHLFYLPLSNHSQAPRRSVFYLEDLHDLTIQGDKTTLLFTGNLIPFSIINCSGIQIKGFEIDFTDPFCLQGTVIKSSAFSYTLSMDEPLPISSASRGFALLSHEGEIRGSESIEWDEDKKRRVFRAKAPWIMAGKSSHLNNGTFRVFSPGHPAVGNKVITRIGDRTQPGILIHHSENISLNEIEIRHCKAMGVLGQMSENIDLHTVSIAPGENSVRFYSARDDAFHFSNCRGFINMNKCSAIGQMDDGLNVHGTYLKAEKLTASTLRLTYGHQQSKGFNPFRRGDLICLRDRETLKEKGKASCLYAEQINEKTIEILLQSALSIPRHTIVENLSTAPDLNVDNCVFMNNRARAVLVTSPGKVRIRNSYFAPTGAAILIAADSLSWFESGGVTDVLIENNTMEHCNTESFQYCKAVISIYPELAKPDKSQDFHRNIRIKGNHIKTYDAPILYGSNTNGIAFENNRIEKTNEYRAWHKNRKAFFFENCKNINIRDNDLDKNLISCEIKEK